MGGWGGAKEKAAQIWTADVFEPLPRELFPAAMAAASAAAVAVVATVDYLALDSAIDNRVVDLACDGAA